VNCLIQQKAQNFKFILMNTIMINQKKGNLLLMLIISISFTALILTSCESEELQVYNPDTSLDLEITKTVVFNNRTFDKVKRLWIKEGGKLIIKNSTLSFIKYDPSTKNTEIHQTGIIVEQGGDLIIENSTLKSINRDEFWKGITFLGGKSF